jgi:hypothetical protein
LQWAWSRVLGSLSLIRFPLSPCAQALRDLFNTKVGELIAGTL